MSVSLILSCLLLLPHHECRWLEGVWWSGRVTVPCVCVVPIDEVFMPRPEEELEMGDMDEADRDIEKFKR